MRLLFISGVDTNVGKTYTASKITQALQSQNIKAITLKPIETGVQDNPLDSLIHLQNAQRIFPNLQLKEINLYSFSLPASPFVADHKQSICIDEIKTHIQSFKDDVDILLIEGAGGLFVPIKRDYFMIDLIAELQECYEMQTLLVCDDRLGMINRFISAQRLLHSYKITHEMYVNLRDEETFNELSYPFLQYYKFISKVEDLLKVFYPKL